MYLSGRISRPLPEAYSKTTPFYPAGFLFKYDVIFQTSKSSQNGVITELFMEEDFFSENHFQCNILGIDFLTQILIHVY